LTLDIEFVCNKSVHKHFVFVQFFLDMIDAYEVCVQFCTTHASVICKQSVHFNIEYINSPDFT